MTVTGRFPDLADCFKSCIRDLVMFQKSEGEARLHATMQQLASTLRSDVFADVVDFGAQQPIGVKTRLDNRLIDLQKSVERAVVFEVLLALTTLNTALGSGAEALTLLLQESASAGVPSAKKRKATSSSAAASADGGPLARLLAESPEDAAARAELKDNISKLKKAHQLICELEGDHAESSKSRGAREVIDIE